MHLGVAGHPNIEIWKQTALKVSTDILNKYRTLRYVLNVWNSDETKLDYVLKENKMYNLAKLLREEKKQH
jgi:Na+-transporting NADH:ubiquinone oxidoreductase subunit NqrA